MSDQDVRALVQAVFDTFNNRDLDGATALVSDDFELVDAGAGLTLRGHDALRQWFEGFLTAGPDGYADLKNVVVAGDWAGSEHVGTFTRTGTLLSPSGAIPPTGRRVEIRIAETYQVRDGKLVALHAYYDVATILQQLGLMPEGAAT
jgi:steroid delta-isomerase-like uncharacterized protein